jgi:hypothetical protein
MTLVAYHGFGNGVRPVLVSDILLSAQRPTAQDLILPTVGQAAPIPLGTMRYGLAGVGQKTAILSNNLVIACSGTEVYYRVFATYLGEFFDVNTSLPSEEAVRRLTDYLSDEQTKAALGDMSGFVCYVTSKDDKRHVTTFYFDCAKPAEVSHPISCNSPLFDQVLAYGSGARTYANIACTMTSAGRSSSITSAFYSDIVFTFVPLGRFLAKEVASGLGYLNENWGGGFEVTVCDWGQFRKIDNIIYIIADVAVGEERGETNINPHKIIKLRYVNEHLFIRSISLNHINRSEFRIAQDNIVYVKPMVRKSAKPDGADLGIQDNEWLCYACSYVGPSGQDDSVVMVVSRYGVPTPSLPYSIRECQDHIIRIEFSEKLLKSMVDSVWFEADKPEPKAASLIWGGQKDI